MKKSTLPLYIGIFAFLLIVGYIIYSKKQLKERGKLLNAKTMRWVSLAQGGYNLQYSFFYGDEKIRASNVFNDFPGNKRFENRYFPVMYYPGLGGHSQLLIRPNDFKKFNLPFPDSLEWVLPYLED